MRWGDAAQGGDGTRRGRGMPTKRSVFEGGALPCVWFGGREGREIPETLKMAGVNSESDALKALGAYIGENERVSNLLLRNLRKHKTIFRSENGRWCMEENNKVQKLYLYRLFFFFFFFCRKSFYK